MPSFSRGLEKALHQAMNLARERNHEFATLEHRLRSRLGPVADQAAWIARAVEEGRVDLAGGAELDAFMLGDSTALDAAQQRGLALFIGKAGCVKCHSGSLLSDFDLHVIGTRQAGIGRDTTPGDDLGWGEHGGVPYAFRTPPLRQVAETAPVETVLTTGRIASFAALALLCVGALLWLATAGWITPAIEYPRLE